MKLLFLQVGPNMIAVALAVAVAVAVTVPVADAVAVTVAVAVAVVVAAAVLFLFQYHICGPPVNPNVTEKCVLFCMSIGYANQVLSTAHFPFHCEFCRERRSLMHGFASQNNTRQLI